MVKTVSLYRLHNTRNSCYFDVTFIPSNSKTINLEKLFPTYDSKVYCYNGYIILSDKNYDYFVISICVVMFLTVILKTR